MDNEDFRVFSTKLSAWWGTNGVWVSDYKSARTFTEEAAIKFAKTRYRPGESFDLCIVDDRVMQKVFA